MEKKLVRSRKKKVIAGIGGGLGDYLDVDPVIIRIIIVLITIFNGIGLIIYIVMWIVIPEEPLEIAKEKNFSEDGETEKDEEFQDTISEQPAAESKSSGNGRVVVGAILIITGIIFLSEKFFPFVDFEFVFAIGLVALGVSLLFNFFKKSENS